MASSDARAATIGSVTTGNGDRAAAIVARRKRLGYYTPNAFISASGLGKEGVKSAEAGTARADTYDKIEAWLDVAEAQAGLADSPPARPMQAAEDHDPQTVTFRLRGNFGVEVTVQGPVTNLDELEAQVERLLERMERPESSD